MAHLLIFGLGFCGAAVARAAAAAGMDVTATSRSPGAATPVTGARLVAFDDASPLIPQATHLLSTAPPGRAGDPVLAHHGEAIRTVPHLRWIGYLSTTGVYGDRQGGWVDEDTEPAPTSDRARRRLAAEQEWRDAAGARPLDLFRLGGIYGPGRSQLDDLRAGHAHRMLQPGHMFGRIHVDDIAGGVMAAIGRPPEGTRVLNFADDEPAESAVVVAEAAHLLGLPVPLGRPLEQAWPGMSEMARSFWAENRKVASRKTQDWLGYRWRYPSYREGLRAILQQERGHDPA
jgi:nucleoside-diphosphate-sugar epimerase